MKKVIFIILLTFSILLVTGCSSNNISNVPSDFLFIMDVKSAEEIEDCVNVNIRIDADGKGHYETYDTGCAIQFDTNHMVTYQQSQVINKGQFKLSKVELETLWEKINANNFFELTDDYRMSMGFSYAFVVV